MNFNQRLVIFWLCALFLSLFSTPSFSWSCNSNCNIKGAFGIPDLVAKAACESYKGLNCGIKIPTLNDTIEDTRKTIESLLNIGCAIPFETYVGGVYNACINGSDGFSDIANAPRSLQLAAAILTELGVYRREDFNNVKVMWCNTISAGANGMVPAPDRILIIRDYRDTEPYNNHLFYEDASVGYLQGGITALFGHEMTHIQQIRNSDFEKFSCNYSTEMIKHGGTGEGNSFEKEAYARQRDINRLLENYQPTKSDDQLINDFFHPQSSSSLLPQQQPSPPPVDCNNPRQRRNGIDCNQTQQSSYPPIISTGFPSGAIMQNCGCWGFNPPVILNEPRCQSGQVELRGCNQGCSTGGQAYGYLCR